MLKRKQPQIPSTRLLFVAAVVTVVGITTLVVSLAATPAAFEAESGALSGGARLVSNAGASGGQVVQFGSPAPTPTPTTAPTPTPGSLKPTGVPGTWTLKFDDEFSGTTLDRTKWSPCWFSPTCGSMNNVKTDPANLSVTGGNLVLTLASSTSGALVSSDPHGGAQPGYEFQYGVIEARVYFPGSGSTSIYNWPAWWTNGQSWPTNGENDIAEVLGGEMTVNYHSTSGSHNQGTVPGNWTNAFHTYTLHRQPGKCDVYYDGVKVKSYPTDDAGSMQYMILNIGYSSSFPVYGTASQVKVDYVRAWQ